MIKTQLRLIAPQSLVVAQRKPPILQSRSATFDQPGVPGAPMSEWTNVPFVFEDEEYRKAQDQL